MSAVVTVIDYGIGNVQSILNALAKLKITAGLSDNKDVILNSDSIILPGVGAFGKAIEELQRKDLDVILKKFAATGKPLLGICLGMQLLFEESEEFGVTKGLGLIEGKVVKFPSTITEKLPHISWNNLYKPDSRNWENTILQPVTEEDDFYFVHSFICKPDNAGEILSETEYGGKTFCSSVQKNNIYGCQFHPEKSGERGLSIIEGFINVTESVKCKEIL